MIISNISRQLLFASLLTALTSAGAFIRIPFPLAPITLQTLFTLLAGCMLLPRYAFLSQAAYLVLGLAGLPVFANGGGLGYILQPTFGYLLSLPIAAWLISFLNTRTGIRNSLSSMIIINIIASILILALGSCWLYMAVNVWLMKAISFRTVWISGFLIFIPGEILKASIAAFLAKQLKIRLNFK